MYFSKGIRFNDTRRSKLSIPSPTHMNTQTATTAKTPSITKTDLIDFNDKTYKTLVKSMKGSVLEVQTENKTKKETLKLLEKVSKQQLDIKNIEDILKPEHIPYKGLLANLLTINEVSKPEPGTYECKDELNKRSHNIKRLIDKFNTSHPSKELKKMRSKCLDVL